MWGSRGELLCKARWAGSPGWWQGGRAMPPPTRVKSHPTWAALVTLHRVRGQASAYQTSLRGCNRSKASQRLRSGDLAQEGTWPDYRTAAWLRQDYGRVHKRMPPGRLPAAQSQSSLHSSLTPGYRCRNQCWPWHRQPKSSQQGKSVPRALTTEAQEGWQRGFAYPKGLRVCLREVKIVSSASDLSVKLALTNLE